MKLQKGYENGKIWERNGEEDVKSTRGPTEIRKMILAIMRNAKELLFILLKGRLKCRSAILKLADPEEICLLPRRKPKVH